MWFNYGLQGNDIDLNFMTAGDYTDFLDPINKMMKLLKHYPGVTDLHTNLNTILSNTRSRLSAI